MAGSEHNRGGSPKHSSAASSTERRRAPRAPIVLRVEYQRVNAFFADYTRDIGHGGTFIRTPKPLPPGTEFEFQLHVPRLSEPLRLRGRVQWRLLPEQAAALGKEPGMGIGFVFASEAERLRLEAIVERLMVESLGRPLYEELMQRLRQRRVRTRSDPPAPPSGP